MTVQELIYRLEAMPDNNAEISFTMFHENAPVGQRILDDQPIFIYHDNGVVWMQNKEWDDGAS